jgi:hypothetical protein
MIGHKLSNKTKSATVAESKLFHQQNKPQVLLWPVACNMSRQRPGKESKSVLLVCRARAVGLDPSWFPVVGTSTSTDPTTTPSTRHK